MERRSRGEERTSIPITRSNFGMAEAGTCTTPAIPDQNNQAGLALMGISCEVERSEGVRDQCDNGHHLVCPTDVRDKAGVGVLGPPKRHVRPGWDSCEKAQLAQPTTKHGQTLQFTHRPAQIRR